MASCPYQGHVSFKNRCAAAKEVFPLELWLLGACWGCGAGAGVSGRGGFGYWGKKSGQIRTTICGQKLMKASFTSDFGMGEPCWAFLGTNHPTYARCGHTLSCGWRWCRWRWQQTGWAVSRPRPLLPTGGVLPLPFSGIPFSCIAFRFLLTRYPLWQNPPWIELCSDESSRNTELGVLTPQCFWVQLAAVTTWLGKKLHPKLNESHPFGKCYTPQATNL